MIAPGHLHTLPFGRPKILLEPVNILDITKKVNARVLVSIVNQPLRIDVVDPPAFSTIALGHLKILDLAMCYLYNGRKGIFLCYAPGLIGLFSPENRVARISPARITYEILTDRSVVVGKSQGRANCRVIVA